MCTFIVTHPLAEDEEKRTSKLKLKGERGGGEANRKLTSSMFIFLSHKTPLDFSDCQVQQYTGIWASEKWRF